MFKSLALAAALAAAPQSLIAESPTEWVVTPDGWAIAEDMKCADPGRFGVVCQIFDKGTQIPAENFGNMSAETILAMHPGLRDFMAPDGTFTVNVIAEIVS